MFHYQFYCPVRAVVRINNRPDQENLGLLHASSTLVSYRIYYLLIKTIIKYRDDGARKAARKASRKASWPKAQMELRIAHI
jgi:hypothetical protein